MLVEDTTLSGPSEASAVSTAEFTVSPAATPAATLEQPAIDPLLSLMGPDGEALHKQLLAEAETIKAAASPQPTPTAEAEVPVETEAAQPEPETGEEEAIPAGIEAMQKRIAKITAQKSEALAKAEAAQRELEQAKAELQNLRNAPPAVAPTPQEPLAHITSLEQLEQVESLAEDFIAWGFRNLNGGTRKEPNGEEVYLSAEQIGERMAAYDRLLRKAVPARRTYFAQRTQWDAQAAKDFPFLADPNSEGSKLAEHFLKTVPYTGADAKGVAATWAEGMLLLKQRQAQAAAPKPPAKPLLPQIAKPSTPPTPVAPTPPVSSPQIGLRPAMRQQNSAAVQSALEHLQKNPSDPDAQAAYLRALDQV